MKRVLLKSIVFLVFLLLFDGLFLLFDDPRQCPRSVLVSVAGVNIAYFSLLLALLLSPRKKGLKVLSGTLYLIWSIYFMFALIVGILFICWTQPTIFWPVLINAVLFSIFVLVLIGSVLANDLTQKTLNIQFSQGDMIRNWTESVYEVRQVVIADAALSKAVERCYDDLKTCPLLSSEEVKDIESEITSAIMLLKDYAADGDVKNVQNVALQIRSLVDKRNRKLKDKHIY